MFTLEQLKTEVIRLGTEQADFVYNPNYQADNEERSPRCFYSKGAKGGPECNGCIFGQALQNLGMPVEEMVFPDQVGAPRIDYVLGTAWREYISIDYKTARNTLIKFRSIQKAQDRGKSWGEAIHILTQKDVD